MTGSCILGLDPGLVCTGYGLIRADGDRLLHLDSGELRPPPKENMGQRLAALQRGLERIIRASQPAEAALEQVFLHRNPGVAIKLGQARGAVMAACALAGLQLHEYSVNEIKLSTVGRGHADKAQVQYMVRTILGLKQSPSTDMADALAAAICHAHHRNAPQWRLRTGRRR